MRKRSILFTCALLIAAGLSAQTAEEEIPYAVKGEFVLKGQRLNYDDHPDGGFTVRVTGYDADRNVRVEVDETGRFEQAIPVEGIQDVTLMLASGRSIKVFTFPDDTLHLEYDIMKVRNTFRITGTNEERDRELCLCWDIYKKFTNRLSKINQLVYTFEPNEQEVIALANRYYDEKIEFIDSYLDSIGEIPFADKFRKETYYEVAALVCRVPGGLERLSCKHPDLKAYRSVRVNNEWVEQSYDSLQYNKLSTALFRNVPAYREFLRSYLAQTDRYFTNATIVWPETKYYFGLSQLNHYPEIRDWYLISVLMEGFDYYTYGEILPMYEDFTARCTDEDRLAPLRKKHDLAQRLGKGQPAPDFELVDMDGNTVRLSDFKGKAVYIDFWATWCGPCVSQFTGFLPAVKEKYKEEDVVYLYVCISSKEENWRPDVEKYGLTGTNLFVPGWREEKICQDYNVQSVLHYVVIDREGKIVSNKNPRLTILAAPRYNELDEALGIPREARE